MFTRPRRQTSVSSKAELGSDMKRTKSKNSAKTASLVAEDELKPKVLFKVIKDDVNVRNIKKNSAGLINKGKLDHILDRMVERTSKSNNKNTHLVMSSSQIGQQ